MKKVFVFISVLILSVSSFAQIPTKYYLRFDSVYIFSANNGELILQNSTRNKTGSFLQNIGNGRTKFAYAVDSSWMSGDTLYVHRGDGSIVIPLGGLKLQDGNKVDVTVAGNTWTVNNNVITNEKIRQAAGVSLLGNISTGTANVRDIIANNDNEVMRRSGSQIGFGPINLNSFAATAGSLPSNKGGTGTGSYSNGDILFANGTSLATLAIGPAGSFLSVIGGINTPGWSSLLSAQRGGTGLSSFAVGDILYASSTTALARRAPVAAGSALLSNGSAAPLWGKVGLTTHVSGVLPIANGGTGVAVQPKRYRALLSQTGTSDPAVTVLENTLTGSVVWTRSDVGVYHGTLTGSFLQSKTHVLSGSVHAGDNSIMQNVRAIRGTDDYIIVNTLDSAALDGLLNYTSIDITVYP